LETTVTATSRRVRRASLAVAALLAVLAALAPAAPASAAPVAQVRLAHLSPDTPAVDVYLSASAGGAPATVIPAVGYGAVSPYLTLAPGSYAVAMRRAGAAPDTPPVLSAQVSAAGGKAYTVAAVGRLADLGLRVLDDDLSLPADGRAKVRLLQASVRAPVLDVAVEGGDRISAGLAFATTSPYRSVDPGRWRLRVQAAGGAASTLECDLAAGNVYTVLLLDSATGGGLTAEPRTDARRQGRVPAGGVETGAGGDRGPAGWWPAAAAVLAVLAAVAARPVRRCAPARRPAGRAPAGR
jgi:hypothetical protein